MLDDLLKIHLDPYFKPKKVDDPDRENLFELIYSPGNTINSKEKVNKRRDYAWDDLYVTQASKDEFMAHRFSSHKDRLTRLRNTRSVNRTPKKENETKRSITVRDDNHLFKQNKVQPMQLYTGHTFNNQNLSQTRISKNEMTKSNQNFNSDVSKTETVLPKIKNTSDDKSAVCLMNRQFMQPNSEYVDAFDKFHSRSKTLLKKKKIKKQQEIAKIEEQFNFMNKFNQDVRERNKMLNLKVRTHQSY